MVDGKVDSNTPSAIAFDPAMFKTELARLQGDVYRRVSKEVYESERDSLRGKVESIKGDVEEVKGLITDFLAQPHACIKEDDLDDLKDTLDSINATQLRSQEEIGKQKLLRIGVGIFLTALLGAAGTSTWSAWTQGTQVTTVVEQVETISKSQSTTEAALRAILEERDSAYTAQEVPAALQEKDLKRLIREAIEEGSKKKRKLR